MLRSVMAHGTILISWGCFIVYGFISNGWGGGFLVGGLGALLIWVILLVKR